MPWTEILTARSVTKEILSAAEGIFDGWFAESPEIDWDDFIDRLDGMTLEDGTKADLGFSMSSPAVKKIKAHIRKYRDS